MVKNLKIYEIGTGYTPIPAQMGAATEIVVEELTKAFLKLGADVEIIDIAAEQRPATDLPIREVKVPRQFSGTDVQLGIMHKLKRVVYSVALAGELKKILKKETEPVILHFHNQYNLFFFLKLVPAALRKKARIAYTNHSHIWHSRWEEIRTTVQKRYFQEVYCLKHADYIFVLNPQTKETLTNHLYIAADRVFLMDNGVNVDNYCPLALQENAVFLAEQQLNHKKVFVHVGSVCDRKNQMEAIRLLLPLMREDPDVVFCYAGGLVDSAYQESIVRFARENLIADRVRYLGEVEPGASLNKIYNCSKAMVFPSKAEGFSLVILEAMAAGVPVIINSSLRFSLEDYCLRYTDESEFYRIVNAHILNPCEREILSCRARSAVSEKYSWDQIADKHLAIWGYIGETA